MGNSRLLVPVRLIGLGAALLAAAIVFGSAWRAEHRAIGEWGYPLDDTWIHAQIARNIVQGHGWSYNPGVPVQNSSGPLWTLLLAAGFSLTPVAGWVWVPKVLGALSFGLCIYLVWRLAWLLTADGLAAAFAALFTGLSGSLAWHGLSGMETPLAALLVAGTFDAFYRWTSGRRRFAWVIFAALAAMARPEALLLVPLLGLLGRRDRIESARFAWRADLREALLAGGLALLLLLPYFVMNLRLSGSLFPTTFAAKTAHTGIANGLVQGDLKEVLVSLSLYPYVWSVHAFGFWCRKNVLIVLATIFGAWALARGPRRAWAPGLFLLALPALRGMAAPHEIPSIQQGRYLAGAMPILFTCAGIGVAALVRSASMAARLRWVAGGVLIVAALAWVRLELRMPHVGGEIAGALRGLVPWAHSTLVLDSSLQSERLALGFAILLAAVVVLFDYLPRMALRPLGFAIAGGALLLQAAGAGQIASVYASNVRNIHEMDVQLGRWVRAHVPDGTRIAVNDIGAIAYFGARPIVDAIGLATPELTPYLTPRRLRTLIGMRPLRPSMFILFPTWFPEWTTRPSLLSPVMRHSIDKNTILGGSVAIVYQADWDRFGRYYPDALLEKLDPVDADASFAGHWRRGLANLALTTRARLFAFAADAKKTRNDLAGAERDYRRAIAIDPLEVQGWKGLLEVYGAQRDEAKYGAAAQEMVQALPHSAPALEALGDFQLATRAGASTAERSFEAALGLHPDNVRLLGKLENLARGRGDAAAEASYQARRVELERAVAGALGSP